LVHTDDIAGGFGVPFIAPESLCHRVVSRLFPWAPGEVDAWLALQWANGRVFLPGYGRLGANWTWHCLYAVNASSLQQAVIPEHLRGRVLATISLISTGAIPIGSLFGGLLGVHIGLRGTVLVAGCGTLLSLPWILFPSVRSLRQAPV
jgi:hypothetical protein